MEFFKNFGKSEYIKNIENIKDKQFKKNDAFDKFNKLMEKKVEYDNEYLNNLKKLNTKINKLYDLDLNNLNEVFRMYFEDINVQIQHLSILINSFEINITNKIKPEIVKYINLNTLIVDNLYKIEENFTDYEDHFKDLLSKYNTSEDSIKINNFSKNFKERYIKINYNKNKLINNLKELEISWIDKISKNKLELNINNVNFIKNYEFEYQEIIKVNNNFTLVENKEYNNYLKINPPFTDIFNLIDYFGDRSNLYNYLKILLNNNPEISFKFIFKKSLIDNYIEDLKKFISENKNHKNFILDEFFLTNLKNILNVILGYFYNLNKYKDISDIIFLIQNLKFIDNFLFEYLSNCKFLILEEVLSNILVNNKENKEINNNYILVNIISISEICGIDYKKIINQIVPYLADTNNIEYIQNLKNNMRKKYQIYIFKYSLFKKNSWKIFN